MPRPDKILKYATITALQHAISYPARLKNDFVVREEQTFADFRNCKARLNALWEQPTTDLKHLFYEEHNTSLLAKYHLTTTATSTT
jgi:hypothetical protein